MKSKRENRQSAVVSKLFIGLLMVLMMSSCHDRKHIRLTEFKPVRHQILPESELVKGFEEQKLLKERKRSENLKQKEESIPVIKTFIAFNY